MNKKKEAKAPAAGYTKMIEKQPKTPAPSEATIVASVKKSKGAPVARPSSSKIDPETAAKLALEKLKGFLLQDWSAKQESARASCVDKRMNYLEAQEKIEVVDVGMALGLLLTAPGLDDTNFRALKGKLDVLGYLAEKYDRLPKNHCKCFWRRQLQNLDLSFTLSLQQARL